MEQKEKKVFTEIAPAMDILEGNEKAEVIFEVPGADPSHIRVEVRNSNLTMEAESSLERCGNPVLFKRMFALSDIVDTDRITAQIRDGVLTLTLPKSEAAQVKKIKVC